MFERFTERARQATVLAQGEARDHNNSHILPVHILAGLIREEHGIAAKTLAERGITIEQVRAGFPAATEPVGAGALPFSHRAKNVLERSLREALSMGHNYIGTEHILLGVSHVGVEGLDLGDEVRQAVRDALLIAPRSEPPEPEVTVALGRSDAKWVLEQMGDRRIAETRARRIWDALSEALR